MSDHAYPSLTSTIAGPCQLTYEEDVHDDRVTATLRLSMKTAVIPMSGRQSGVLTSLTPDCGQFWPIMDRMVSHLQTSKRRTSQAVQAKEGLEKLADKLLDVARSSVADSAFFSRGALHIDRPGRTATQSRIVKVCDQLEGTDCSFEVELKDFPNGASKGMSSRLKALNDPTAYTYRFPDRWIGSDGEVLEIGPLKGTKLCQRMLQYVNTGVDREDYKKHLVAASFAAGLRDACEMVEEPNEQVSGDFLPGIDPNTVKFISGDDSNTVDVILGPGQVPFRFSTYPRSETYLKDQFANKLDEDSQAPLRPAWAEPSIEIIMKEDPEAGIEEIVFHTTGSFNAHSSNTMYTATEGLLEQLVTNTQKSVNQWHERLNILPNSSSRVRERIREHIGDACLEVAISEWEESAEQCRLPEFSGMKDNTERVSQLRSERMSAIKGEPTVLAIFSYGRQSYQPYA